MRVIPVLDILAGRAVRARMGNRDSYAPLSSYLAPGNSGDALAIAHAFHHRLGFGELYIADLDAIMGRPPQHSLRRAIVAELPSVEGWVDAGVAFPARALEVIGCGAARVIIGLETFPGGADPRSGLEGMVAAVGWRAVFSLDLRADQPITVNPLMARLTPLGIAELAAESGIRTIIVLDLDRVGTGTGVDLSLVRAIRRALPDIELVAGGGISDAGDLERLADSGADGALVGSALHDEPAAQGSGFWTRGTFSSTTSPFDA